MQTASDVDIDVVEESIRVAFRIVLAAQFDATVMVRLLSTQFL